MTATRAELRLSAVSTDELDEYEDIVDHDEALVTELDDERMLSDGDELADADAEPTTRPST